ncbi:RsmD family RNA methyltransferase [bacterium]|nr:RsmD family RNA methyltransferase [bacterium]
MRITGGKLHGKPLFLKRNRLRPIQEKARLAIFNLLKDVDSKSFADLFSGTGIMGIEAYSRGAHPVFLVDIDVSNIIANIEQLSLSTVSDLIVKKRDAIRFIASSNRRFDIIFAGPPFIESFYQRIKESLTEIKKHLTKDGIFILQVGKRFLSKDIFPPPDDKRIYGDSVFLFYHH